MPMPITDGAFDYPLAHAGLILTDAERVRRPRGRIAEPALTYSFADEGRWMSPPILTIAELRVADAFEKGDAVLGSPRQHRLKT